MIVGIKRGLSISTALFRNKLVNFYPLTNTFKLLGLEWLNQNFMSSILSQKLNSNSTIKIDPKIQETQGDSKQTESIEAMMKKAQRKGKQFQTDDKRNENKQNYLHHFLLGTVILLLQYESFTARSRIETKMDQFFRDNLAWHLEYAKNQDALLMQIGNQLHKISRAINALPLFLALLVLLNYYLMKLK